MACGAVLHAQFIYPHDAVQCISSAIGIERQQSSPVSFGITEFPFLALADIGATSIPVAHPRTA